MKKVLLLLGITVLAVSCANKELDYSTNETYQVKVSFDWSKTTQIPECMKVVYFPHSGGEPFTDIIYPEGGVSSLPAGTYSVLCYNFDTEKVLFRGVTEYQSFEAYTSAVTRTTYANYTDSEEPTVSEPDSLYACNIDNFIVNRSNPLSLVFEPIECVKHFTYTVKDIVGVENIIDSRGALSGMSGSYLIGQGNYIETSATLLFDSEPEIEKGQICGGFSAFSRCPSQSQHIFTIEILSSKGIYQKSFDVADQLKAGNHIEVSLKGIVIERESNSETESGFDSDVSDWELIEYPLDID